MGATDRRDDAIAIWRAGVAAADPAPLTARAITREGDRLRLGSATLPLEDVRRVFVIGAGKAARDMARGALPALRTVLGDGVEIAGTLLVPDDVRHDGVEPLTVRPVRPADDNRATPRAVAATLEVLDDVRSLGAGDVLVGLFSGGGSATLAAPWPGIPLEDKLAAAAALDGCGATIAEVNALRRHLSLVKGGRLASAGAAALAIVSLLLSDVDGDAPEVIASGPCAPDPTTFADVLDVLDTLDARRTTDAIPPRVHAHLVRGARGEVEETPATLPPNVSHAVVGSPADALAGARREARRRGYGVIDLGRSGGAGMEGGVVRHADAVRRELSRRASGESPAGRATCVLSAGEWTLALPHRPPAGGRCGHFAAALACRLDADPALRGRATVLCGSTDGEDGTSRSAGAVVDERALRAAEAEGLDPVRLLDGAYSLRLLRAGRALLPGGATGTNVQDLRVILVGSTGT